MAILRDASHVFNLNVRVNLVEVNIQQAAAEKEYKESGKTCWKLLLIKRSS